MTTCLVIHTSRSHMYFIKHLTNLAIPTLFHDISNVTTYVNFDALDVEDLFLVVDIPGLVPGQGEGLAHCCIQIPSSNEISNVILVNVSFCSSFVRRQTFPLVFPLVYVKQKPHVIMLYYCLPLRAHVHTVELEHKSPLWRPVLFASACTGVHTGTVHGSCLCTCIVYSPSYKSCLMYRNKLVLS
jgi:hypothetical protein